LFSDYNLFLFFHVFMVQKTISGQLSSFFAIWKQGHRTLAPEFPESGGVIIEGQSCFHLMTGLLFRTNDTLAIVLSVGVTGGQMRGLP
jgi:hypothetical protein